MSPRRWARMTGSTARVTFIGPNRLVSTCARKSLRGDFLKETGVEVGSIVDEDVDAAKVLMAAVQPRTWRHRGG